MTPARNVSGRGRDFLSKLTAGVPVLPRSILNSAFGVLLLFHRLGIHIKEMCYRI